MSTKLDSPTTVEPRHGLSTASASSTVSASSPKVSMFGAKAGFVIPKNKLSGSLVPIFRSGSKVDSGSMVKEESSKQVQRKTKWGLDLTQDATVRKGKTLAYQTRMEQITQQLKSGSLEFEDDQGSESPHASNINSASEHVDQKSKKIELLELERREIIGELLRLNPSYKAPTDYKPLLKESNVPIPIKSYPGYNFIGLLLGPESNTQRRLEEETGAKVRVYGTKLGLMEKREITKSDISEAKDVYEDLYVHVSADTYEKVDTAVALIELLLTPVSGNAGVTPKVVSSPAGNNTAIQTTNQESGFSLTPTAAVIQTVPRPLSLPIQPGQPPLQPSQPPFLPYPAPWFSTNFPPRPSPAFMPQFLPNNTTQFPRLQVPPGMHQYFTNPPNASSVPKTFSPPAFRPQLLVQLPPRQSSSVSVSQPLATLRPSGPVNPQIGPPIRASPVNFSGWSPAPSALARPSMNQMAPPSSNPTMRPPPMTAPSVPSSSGPTQFNVSDNVALPPANFTPHSTPFFSTRPSTTQPIFSLAPSQVGLVPAPGTASSSSGSSMPSPSPTHVSLSSSSPRPTSSAQITPYVPTPFQPPMLMPTPPRLQPPIPVQPQMQLPQPLPAIPTSASPAIITSFPPATNNPIGPPVNASKPLRPISGDFTFQPLKTQPPSSSSNPPASHSSALQTSQQVPFAAPKAPSFRPVLQNVMPVATAAPITSFPANASNIRPPPPIPQGYPSITPAQPVAPAIPMGSPSFPNPPKAPSPSGPFPYPTNFQQLPQNQLLHVSRPGGSFTVPNQHLGGKPGGSMPGNAHTTIGSNQIYDPFSPTTAPAPAPPSQAANAANIKKPEPDAEYEDLMASVGVK